MDLTLKSKFKVENIPFELRNLNERPRFGHGDGDSPDPSARS
jgi:hypothetical protein